MASPTSAYELIRGAMRLIGAIAVGETPTAEEANDGLDRLNDLLENWSTQPQAVYTSQNDSVTALAGVSSYTVGTGGAWNVPRPVNIVGAYCTYNGVDFPVAIVGKEEYDAISLKTQSQPIVERMLYIEDWPLGKAILWPVPQVDIAISINADRVLTAISGLTDAITLPPGYVLALKYHLALALAPEFGLDPPAQVVADATRFLADIKRANSKPRVSRFDAALQPNQPSVWQRGY